MYIYPNPEKSKTDIDMKHASIEWTWKALDQFAFVAGGMKSLGSFMMWIG